MRLLYVSRWWSHHDIRFSDAWRSAGVDVVALADDGSAPGDAIYPGETLEARLRSALVGFAPDVVHAGPLTDVVPLVRTVWNGPLIAMSWGFDLMDEIDRDQDARRNATGALASADRIIVDNNGPRARAIGLGADESRIVQFPWGIDLGFFTPGESDFRGKHGIPEHGRLVLCSRKHEDIYRVGDVVDAFVAAAPRHPELYLALAGSGSLGGELRSRVERAALADRVAFVGDLDAADLRAAHRAADLYVSASSVDGTSISLLEAMACVTPVCVSRIPGNAEWVDASTGATFAVGDVTALAEEFASVAGHHAEGDDRRAGAAASALERVRERADWSRTVSGLAGLARAAVDAAASR